MEVFYLKINRFSTLTVKYLTHWIEIAKQFPDARAYVICDDPDLTQFVERTINFGELYHEFMTSRRDSQELHYIIQNAIADRWKPAGYAHLTPFLHSREMGYENFWNIDGDDLGLFAEPERIAQLLLTVKNYAEEYEIDEFSIDMWRTITYGHHWTLGVVYTRNSIDWLEILKSHCQDSLLQQLYKNTLINVDWFMTYLNDEIQAAQIESFYAENLRFIHHDNSDYIYPLASIRYFADGRLYFDVLVHEFGMGRDGSITAASDTIKFDIGITATESMAYVKKFFSNDDSKWTLKFELENHPENFSVTLILPMTKMNPPQFIQVIQKSLFDSALWNIRLLVVDGGMTNLERAMFPEEAIFNVRFKVIKGNTDASLAELMNEGLSAAKSKYVMFLDATDIFVPEMLASLYEVAEKTGADIVHDSAHYVTQEKINSPEQLQQSISIQTVVEESGMTLNEYKILSHNDLPTLLESWINNPARPKIYNQLIRREFLVQNKISFSSEVDNSELFFALQCMYHAEKYVKLAQPLYLHLSN